LDDICNLTVVAVGGNALIDASKPPTVDNQFLTTFEAMIPVVDLIERGEQVVIVHGNGPQVGFMQLRSELSREDIHQVPLDSLVADTQGSMGYMIQRALREELLNRGIHRPIVTIVTEVEVD
jgi:carbamate kinase